MESWLKPIKESLTNILGEAAFNTNQIQVPKDVQKLVKAFDYVMTQADIMLRIEDKSMRESYWKSVLSQTKSILDKY